MRRGTRPVYRANPRPGPKNNRGLKVQDDIDGTWHYQDEMAINDDGQRVYSGDRRTYDRRYDLDGQSGVE